MMGEPMDREAILEDIKRVAAQLQRPWVSRSEYKRHGRFGIDKVYQTFGSWNKSIAAAGLMPTPRASGVANLQPGAWNRIPDEELEAEFMRVHTALGKVPTMYEFGGASKFSADTYKKRFGGWRQAVANYLGAEALAPAPPQPQQKRPSKRGQPQAQVTWPQPTVRTGRSGQVFGAPLNFRVLRHEPVNEQGVVFLFGMVAQELGFLIDAIQTGFPDCTAKRLTKGGRYEAVRVEFEFKSSHFREQGHNPDKCDLIVCWQHDWRDCPVDVLELKSAIRELHANV
jgi:hypothetical protein